MCRCQQFFSAELVAVKTHHHPIGHAPRFFDLLEIFFDIALVANRVEAEAVAFFKAQVA